MLDDPSAGSVSERVKRKKTRSRHEVSESIYYYLDVTPYVCLL